MERQRTSTRRHELVRDAGNWIITLFAIFGVLWVVGMVSGGLTHFKPSFSATVDVISADAFGDQRARYDRELYLEPYANPPKSEGRPESLESDW